MFRIEWEKKEGVNLRLRKSWIYVSIITFLSAGFFLFLTSNFYLKTEEKVLQTEMNKVLDLSTTSKVTILKTEYNPRGRFMEISFKTQGNIDNEFVFKAQEKVNPMMNLPVKELYNEGGKHVVRIQELSSNWGAVALDIYDEKSKEETINARKFIDEAVEIDQEVSQETGENLLLKTIFSDQRMIKVNEELVTVDKKTYALFFTESEKTELEMKIKRIDEVIKNEEEGIQKSRNRMTKLQEEVTFQTSEEAMETQSKVTSLESKIKDSERNIKTFTDEKNSVLEKIEKLKTRENESTVSQHQEKVSRQ